MKATFDQVMPAVLKHEGGFVNHPKDPGGATNKGITLAVFIAWRKSRGKPVPTVTDLKAITNAEAIEIYRFQYWSPIKGDDLPAGIDYAVLDCAINSGPSKAAKLLQAVVGAGVDGMIGSKTIALTKAAAETDEIDVISRFSDKRLAFMRSLSTWSTFGKGWTTRVNEVKANAWAIAKSDPLYGVTAGAGQCKAQDKDVSFVKASLLTVKGAGTTAGAVGSIGALATETADKLQVFGDVTVVQYACIALTIAGFAATAYATWAKFKAGIGDDAAIVEEVT